MSVYTANPRYNISICAQQGGAHNGEGSGTSYFMPTCHLPTNVCRLWNSSWEVICTCIFGLEFLRNMTSFGRHLYASVLFYFLAKQNLYFVKIQGLVYGLGNAKTSPKPHFLNPLGTFLYTFLPRVKNFLYQFGHVDFGLVSISPLQIHLVLLLVLNFLINSQFSP